MRLAVSSSLSEYEGFEEGSSRNRTDLAVAGSETGGFWFEGIDCCFVVEVVFGVRDWA